MKNVITGLALVLALTATNAIAGEGQLSNNELDAFGLTSLNAVSDAEGMEIRGQGTFAFVAGGSYSSLPGTATANVYAAGASHITKSSQAEGGSISASNFQITLNSHVLSVSNGSAGGASASAK